MSRRIWLPLAAALLALWSVTAAAGTGDINLQSDGTYWNIKAGLKTNSSGHVQVTQTNRAVDDNGLQSMLAMGGLQGITPGGSQLCTSFVPMKQFVGGSLQIDWADSLQSTASNDSVAFEVFVFGKRSTTNDGIDYFIDMDPTTTRLDGILVFHPRNGWAASTLAKSTIYAPTAILGAAAASDIQRYSVSVPLYNRVGGAVSEEYLGCLVVNRSGTQGGGTVNGLNIIHGLNIQVEQKVN